MIIGEKVLKSLLRGQIFASEASLFRHHNMLAMFVGLYYEFPAICLKCSILEGEESYIPSIGIFFLIRYTILVLPTYHSFHTAHGDVDHICLHRKTIVL